MQRKQFDVIKSRLEEPRRFIQIITGPRQVGKTTLTKQVLNALSIPYQYISADGAQRDDVEWIARNWAAVRAKVRREKLPDFVLAIDEVQQINDWSRFVKAEYDYDTFHDIPIKVLLTGSSRVMLMKGMSESLMGRFELIPLPFWSFKEMQETFDFNLQDYIFFGGYPGAASLIKDERRWRNYIRNSIIKPTMEKDVLIDRPIQNPALLRKTLELASSYSGQELSLQKIIGELQDFGSMSTVKNYLQLLKDSCFVAPLQKYSNEPVRRKSSVPKMQVYDNALKTFDLGFSFAETLQKPELWGRLYESCAGSHLLNASMTDDMEIFYWRDRNDEVDYVVRYSGKVTAIEVKSNLVKSSKGLNTFVEKFHPDSSFIVGEGTSMPLNEFLKIPLAEFLQ